MDGFLAKLEEDRAANTTPDAGSANALVPLNARLDQAFGAFTAGFEKDNKRGPRLVSEDAFEDGQRAGRSINLNRPIEVSRPPALGRAVRR